MKLLVKIFANLNILVGVLLIVSPIAYLSVNSFVLKNTNTVSANAEKENRIIAYNPLQNPDKKSTQLITQTDTLTPNLKIDVPQNDVASYGNRIKIDSIGVDTRILESWNAEKALEQGVWRMPDQGSPLDASKPIVLAAHRWGWDYLSEDFRKKNLFLELPNIKEGDIIEVSWDGAIHQYKVNYKEEHEYVTRLEDLILLTCKDFDSDTRVFVYAEKIS